MPPGGDKVQWGVWRMGEERCRGGTGWGEMRWVGRLVVRLQPAPAEAWRRASAWRKGGGMRVDGHGEGGVLPAVRGGLGQGTRVEGRRGRGGEDGRAGASKKSARHHCARGLRVLRSTRASGRTGMHGDMPWTVARARARLVTCARVLTISARQLCHTRRTAVRWRGCGCAGRGGGKATAHRTGAACARWWIGGGRGDDQRR